MSPSKVPSDAALCQGCMWKRMMSQTLKLCHPTGESRRVSARDPQRAARHLQAHASRAEKATLAELNLA